MTGYSRLLEQVIAADRMNLDASAVDLVYNLLTKVYNSKTHLFPDLAAPYPTSVVSHAVCTLSRTALARRYLAMMSLALAVQTKGLGLLL